MATSSASAAARLQTNNRLQVVRSETSCGDSLWGTKDSESRRSEFRRPFLFAKHPSCKISCVQRARIKVNVCSNSSNSARHRRAHSALAYLLLLTIGYGAIVEAAHSHGSSSTRASQLTAVSNGDNSPSSYQSDSNHGDCSLCQFHRQLFGGLVAVILVALKPQQSAFLSEETPAYLSTSALPTSSRGPPLF